MGGYSRAFSRGRPTREFDFLFQAALTEKVEHAVEKKHKADDESDGQMGKT